MLGQLYHLSVINLRPPLRHTPFHPLFRKFPWSIPPNKYTSPLLPRLLQISSFLPPSHRDQAASHACPGCLFIRASAMAKLCMCARLWASQQAIPARDTSASRTRLSAAKIRKMYFERCRGSWHEKERGGEAGKRKEAVKCVGVDKRRH